MKRTVRFLLTTLLLVGACASAYGQHRPDSLRKAAFAEFREQNGPQWEVVWNQKTGAPAALVGARTRAYKGAPEQAARAFLREHYALFGMKPNLPDLRSASVRKGRDVQHVRFEQSYEGLPIYEAEYLVHVLPDGSIIMANGNYYPDVNLPTTEPKVSEAQGRVIALKELEASSEPERAATGTLLILPVAESFRLAWQYTLSLSPADAWIYFIDAQNGAILLKENLIMDATGTGTVHPTHPGLSSPATRNLYRLSGNGRLQGTYAYIVNDVDNDVDNEAYSPTNGFSYSTSSTHFDEVNLYYHIDRFRNDYINSLADPYNPVGFTQITAHAHAPRRGSGNAWFSTETGHLYFNDENAAAGIFDFAKEDKVIYHEYGHAVFHGQNSGIMSTYEEEGAISEGVPDYFAGAFTGRTRILDYAAPAHMRDMAVPYYGSYEAYRGGSRSPHEGGEFFSSILWDIRNTPGVNPAQIDWLVYAALSYVSSAPTFSSFRAAMIAEDLANYGGANQCTIRRVFADKGIDTPCPPPSLSVSLNGPLVLQVGTASTFTSSVNGGTAPFTFTWFLNGRNQRTVSTSSAYDSYSYTPQSANPYQNTLIVEVTDSQGRKGSASHSFRVEDCNDPNFPACRDEYALSGNYPEPFNPSTEITYSLPEAAHVTLVVYDALGREVARLVDGEQEAGPHRARFEAGTLPSGLYLYRLTAGAFTDTRPMMLVR